MKRSWWHVVKHVLFGIHSPSLLCVGQCWCQRKGNTAEVSPEEIKAAIRRSAERAYRTWGE